MGDKEQITKLAVEVAEHRGKVDEFIINTVNYRKDLCGKLDRIQSFLLAIPCKERKAWYDSMGKQVAFMWVVLTILLTAVVGSTVNGWFDRDDMKKSLAMIKSTTIAEAQCLKTEKK
jgi:hypothetical protein